ncbi:MXAN_6640 family putative metalloprotease [Nocardioides sp.]|uniref:MXAN_6640 family putative metalloprotease n=1 Tax=Nocardioides sp. TaxID=35761 RepID=UPI0032192D88
MTPTRARAAALLTALGLACLSGLSSGASAGAADPAAPGFGRVDPSTAPTAVTSLKQAPTTPDRKAAVDALAAVRAIFAPKSPSQARASLEAGGVEATMALRDLALRAKSLSASDQESARDYFDRPATSDDPVCNADVCVHVAAKVDPEDSQDASGAAGANGIPDYVDTVLRTVGHVHDKYLRAGYREPLPDDELGGDDRFDIYLKNVGKEGLYGFCGSDDDSDEYDRWAYCVLDNNYSEFSGTPLENLQVTAAHEYFHATQYAYDMAEDKWFLEATATWAEDEVYDGVDDNVQYLKTSPLTAPFLPLDSFISTGNFANFHYGTWSFFRFLTEKYRATKGGMPVLMLDLMKKVDGSAAGPDQYSWQAVQSVLAKKRTTAAKQFLAFSVANRDPRRSYDEGKANKYPVGPLAGSVKLTRKRSRTNQATVRTEHLSSATYRITPRRLTSRRTKLEVSLDMAPRKRGSMAAVTMFPQKGKARSSTVDLDRRGDGTARVAFSSRKVRYVEVTLANTSGRFAQCFEQYTPFSCYGLPKDDRQKQRISARVVR